MGKARLGTVAIFAVTVAACNNPNTAPVPFDQLPGRLATSFCGFAARCGLGTTFSGSAGSDCQTQTTSYFANTTFAQYQLAITRGTLVYHADAAGQCLGAFDTASCSGFGGGGPAACRMTFVGTVADGGACTISSECGSTSACSGGGTGTTCGMCVHVPQINESCAGMGVAATCATGAFCSPMHLCTAQLAAGSPCDRTMASMCATGLTCMSAMPMGTTGTCATPPAGTPCGAATCTTGQLCDVTGGMAMCRAPRTDGTCTSSAFGGTDCAAGTTCDSATMRCVPLPTLGQICSTACVGPARCVHQMCQPSIDNGASCTSDDVCVSGHCTMGTCAAPPLCTP